MIFLLAGFAWGEDPPASAPQEAVEPAGSASSADFVADSNTSQTPPAKPLSKQARRQQLTVGLYLISCIGLIGGMLLLWIIWWGFRLRYRIRQPLPPAPRGNDFWFLKRAVGDNSLGQTTTDPTRKKRDTADGDSAAGEQNEDSR